MRARKDLPEPVVPKMPDERWTNLSRSRQTGCPLFAGIANAEDILVVFLTKNSGDISTIGELDRSVMAGNGLDRDRSALIGGVPRARRRIRASRYRARFPSSERA